MANERNLTSNHMNDRARKGIFLLFFIGFSIAAPLVVLYTAGYRYHFGTGRIVQTGVLSISSTPKGASISIDGDRSRASTPSLVKNLLPGDHLIRVEKGGYSSWEKTVPVESRSTTFADDIVLFLEAEPALIQAASLAAVTINAQTGRAAYAQSQGQWTEIWTYDPATSEKTLVSRLPVSEEDGIALEWPFDDSTLAVRTSNGKTPSVAYVNAETGSAIDAPVASDVVLSTLADRVAVSRKSGEANVILAYVPLGTYELRSSPNGVILLEDAARERIVLIRSEGGDQPILLNADASVWSWEPDGARLLYSDGFDLHVYDAEGHTDTTVTRLSSAITGVAWYPGHSTVLYAQPDAVYATELDHRDGRNTVSLVSGSDLTAIHVRRSTLFFFGTINETSGLYARPLDR